MEQQLTVFSLSDIKAAVHWLTNMTAPDLIRTFRDGSFELGYPTIGGARVADHQIRHLYFSPSGLGMVAMVDVTLLRTGHSSNRIAQVFWNGHSFHGRFVK
jgi:hypothetical protein